MKTALFVAILLIAISVPAAYASTLQLVTENGNVFSIDYDEILATWELYHGNSTARTALNGTVLQEIDNLQTQIDDLIAKLNSNSTETEIDRLEERVDDLLTQLNSNSTSTETEIERLGDLIANLTSNSDVAIDRLEQLIANLDNATESEITELNELLDELETELESQIDELEAGTGVGAGALGSSGRLVAIPPSGILVYGDHTVRDTRGIINSTIAYLFPGNGFEWATLIRNYDAYDEYEVPVLGMEYTANHGTLTGTPAPSTVELDVDGLPPLTAWALYPNGTDTAVYAGVTNSAGEVLIPRTPNSDATITRSASVSGSSDVRLPARGTAYNTITIDERGIVNDMYVTIRGSLSYGSFQLISPDGSIYPLTFSHSFSGGRTYNANTAGEQLNGDWTLLTTGTQNNRYVEHTEWTIVVNYGNAGKVQSVSGSGNEYMVTVGQAYSGSFELDLMNVTGIVDSRRLLDNSLQTGPDEVYVTGGGGNSCNSSGFYVCSIERNNPATEQISTSSVEYLVTFNNPAKNVDASDFVAMRSIVTAAPKVQNTAFDVWHNTEQASPSTSNIDVSSIDMITSAKLILDVSGHDFTEDWDLTLTVPGGTVIQIAGNGQPTLNNADGLYEFYLGEMIGIDPTNGNWVLGVIDNSSHDDDPVTPGFTVPNVPEGQINSWSLEFEHATTSRAGTVGTVTQSGTNSDTYLVPVTGISYSYNDYTLWLKGDNDIESLYGTTVIDPRTEFAPDPHETYDRTSVSISNIPHVRGITVSSSTSSTVTFLVTFSEAVTGVSATDFKVIHDGVPEIMPNESVYTMPTNVRTCNNCSVNTLDTVSINGYHDGMVETVTLNVDISHNTINLLRVYLISPDGTSIRVQNAAVPHLIESFTPDFASQTVNGNWTLQVNRSGGLEAINSWSLDFTYADAPTWEDLLVLEANKGDLYTWKPVLSGSHDLRIYPDALVHTKTCTTGGVLIDAHNSHVTCIPNNIGPNFIYTSFTYMRYPVTVDVNISNIQMTKPGRPAADLGYIDGSFKAGDVFFIPIIPGMSVLNIQINGVDAVVHLADVAEPVTILPIPAVAGNPVSSSAAMFITTDGNVTAQVQVTTDRGDRTSVTSDFTARYTQFKTNCNDFATEPGNCSWGDVGNALIQTRNYKTLARNWSTHNYLGGYIYNAIPYTSGVSAASMIASVTFDVYRNGVLVVSESEVNLFAPSSTSISSHRTLTVNTFGYAYVTARSIYDETIFETVKDLSFYAETGDYVEIYITSKTTSSGGKSPLSTPRVASEVCLMNHHGAYRFATYDTTYCYRLSADGTTPIWDATYHDDPTLRAGPVFRDGAPPAVFTYRGDETNEIRGGYILLSSGR